MNKNLILQKSKLKFLLFFILVLIIISCSIIIILFQTPKNQIIGKWELRKTSDMYDVNSIRYVSGEISEFFSNGTFLFLDMTGNYKILNDKTLVMEIKDWYGNGKNRTDTYIWCDTENDEDWYGEHNLYLWNISDDLLRIRGFTTRTREFIRVK